ncbi:von willebrand factor protein [Rutstroemia sp. NJR-2017a WRK4]|nr:von willebrand factor protein [Rutstroemia sp. NJR-2017a WRK4]
MSSNNLNPFNTAQRPSYRFRFYSFCAKLGRSKSNASSTSSHATKSLAPTNAFRPANQSNLSDPPPAYTPQHVVPSPSVGSVTSPTTIGSSGPSDIELDGRYGLLATFDTILLIDDSESMGWRSSNPTCWTQTQRALQTIAPIITKYDSDGIDIYFMNNRNKSDMGAPSNGISPGGWRGVTREDTVLEVFSQFLPRGTTPTGRRISQILTPYLTRMEKELEHNREVKPLNLIVGNDHQATQALNALDDDLEKKGVRDMVDTVTWTGRNTTATELTGENILKAVLGAVVRRLDKKAASGEFSRG